MDLDDQVELEHLLFTERKCRSCGVVKTLMDDFYLTRRIEPPYHHILMNVRIAPKYELKSQKRRLITDGSTQIGSSCRVSPL